MNSLPILVLLPEGTRVDIQQQLQTLTQEKASRQHGDTWVG